MSPMKSRIDEITGEVIPVLDHHGHEVPDPTPLAVPAGFKRPETLAEQVRRLVRREVSDYASANGQETFEEAEDFNVGDDFDPTSPYEEFFDPVLQRDITLDEFNRNQNVYLERFKRATREYYARIDAENILGANLYRSVFQGGPERPPKSGSGGSQPSGDGATTGTPAKQS